MGMVAKFQKVMENRKPQILMLPSTVPMFCAYGFVLRISAETFLFPMKYLGKLFEPTEPYEIQLGFNLELFLTSRLQMMPLN